MMRRKRTTPPGKLMLIVFSILLPINFFALIFTGWNDEGAITGGNTVNMCRVIDNILLFPLHAIEGIFHKEIFTGTLFFIGDVVCLVGWSVLLVYCYTQVRKVLRKRRLKKRS